MRSLATTFLLLAFSLASLTGAAQASRLPRASEKAAITKAIVASVKSDFPKGTRFPVTHIRVSTVDADYAAALVGPPRLKGQALTDRATVALKKGVHGWRVVDLGTDQVGCRLPKKVVLDLYGHDHCAPVR